MITPPSNWDTIYNGQNCVLEFRVIINLTADINQTFSLNEVSSAGFILEHNLFDKWSVGNAQSAHLSFTIIDNTYVIALASGQSCEFQTRATNGTDTTDWVTLGYFTIDAVNINGSTTTVSAYDVLRTLGTESFVYTGSITLGEYAQQLSDYNDNPILINSELLDQTARMPTSTSYPSMALRDISLPEAMNAKSIRDIISTAAGFAGGNAYIDNTGALRFARIDATTSAATTSVYASTEQVGIESVWFNGIRVNNSQSDMNVTGGYFLDAFIDDTMTVDSSSPSVSTIRTAKAIYLTITNNDAKNYMMEEPIITINNAGVTPLIGLRDQVSYTDENGEERTFRINGYRLSCSGWCVGTLSTKVTAADVFFGGRSLSRGVGLIDYKWFDFTFNAGSKSSYGSDLIPINDRCVLLRLPDIRSNNLVSAIRMDGQKFSVHFDYYYDSHGGSHSNVDVDYYAMCKQYLYQRRNSATGYRDILFYMISEQPIDISPNRPKKLTISWDTMTLEMFGEVYR